MRREYIVMLSGNAGPRIRATLGSVFRRMLLDGCPGDCERLVQGVVLGSIKIGQPNALGKGLEVGASV